MQDEIPPVAIDVPPEPAPRTRLRARPGLTGGELLGCLRRCSYVVAALTASNLVAAGAAALPPRATALAWVAGAVTLGVPVVCAALIGYRLSTRGYL